MAGADPRSKKAELRVDAQDGILASLEFLVKQPLGEGEGGTHTSAEALFSFVSQQPRSLALSLPLFAPSNQPTNPAPTRDGQGASRGLLLRLTRPLECAGQR